MIEVDDYELLKDQLDRFSSWLRWDDFKGLYTRRVSNDATLARRVIIDYGHGGYTRLHYHLRYKPPVDVIRLMVDSHPEGVFIQDHFGDTPLHSAIAKNASVYVMECFITAQRQIATPHENLLYCRNNNLEAPIHKAMYACNTQVLNLLIRADNSKGSLLLKDNQGQIPLQLAVRHPEVPHDRVQEANGDLNPIIKLMIEQTSLAIQRSALSGTVMAGSAISRGAGASTRSLLAQCIDCVPFLCSSVAARLLGVIMAESRFNDEELVELKEDGESYYHFLARQRWENVCICNSSGVKTSVSSSASSSTIGEDMGISEPLRLLVEKNPKGAALRNIRGELPLHIALKAGHNWVTGVEILYTAFPDAAKERDTVTKHYPYAIALLMKDPCITTVFVLLRDCASEIYFSPLAAMSSTSRRGQKRERSDSEEDSGSL